MREKCKSFFKNNLGLLLTGLFLLFIIAFFYYNQTHPTDGPISIAYKNLTPGEKYTVEATVSFNTDNSSQKISSSEKSFIPDNDSGNIVLDGIYYLDWIKKNVTEDGNLVLNYTLKDTQGKIIATDESQQKVTH